MRKKKAGRKRKTKTNWTKEEIKELKKLFPKKSNEEVGQLLHKQVSDVKNTAYSLGLKKANGWYWTEEEIAYLRANWENFTSEELGQELGRSAATIRKKMQQLRELDEKAAILAAKKQKQLIYTKITPLGPKPYGHGTFDTFFDNQKYTTLGEALHANDVVLVDFVQDQDGIIYFEAYRPTNPEVKKRQPLVIQHFPFGIDVADDAAACQLAEELLKAHEISKA